jgi:hypothetical protein
MVNQKTQLDELISKLESPLKETVWYLRSLVLKIDPEIAEQIKWNSPSFYYTGAMKPFDAKEYKRDLLVLNLNRGKVLLVFPTGAKIKDQLKGKDYPDGRKIITIEDLADVKAKANDLE